MTEDQLRYWTLQETKRHDVATEGETAKHNRATEQETAQHNRMTEQIDLGKLGETIQHNRATEQIDLGKLAETTRHNVVSENIDMGKLAETSRHNKATEAISQQEADTKYQQLVENIRHDAVTEDIDRSYKEVIAASKQLENKLKADGLDLEAEKVANARDEWTNKLEETKRHNEVSEKQKWVDSASNVVKTINDIISGSRKFKLDVVKSLLPYAGK